VLDLSRFVTEQRRAVLAPDGPLVIVAGPGSGKTTVLAARIAYLILSRQTPPTSILALTFATKAARELRARLTGLLGPSGQAVDVMTFHAFGLRVIRQWSEELGYGLGPVAVYGDSDARSLLVEAARRLGIPTAGPTLRDLSTDLTRIRLGVQEPLPTVIPGELVCEYERLLRQRGAVDYPAMLAYPLRLLDSLETALRLLQDAYRHVLVDEFQDVCGAQYELVRRLADRHGNLVVVGDPRQALYAWRGADVRFLQRLGADFPDVRVLTLDQNFRSTGQIIGLANALAESLGGFPPLWTDNPPGTRTLHVVVADERDEAQYVASEIARLLRERIVVDPGDVAVLYRTNRQAQELILALRSDRVPYRVLGRGDLLSRHAVRDALAYLRLAINGGDVAALCRIVDVPPRRLGRLAEMMQEHPCGVEQLALLADRYGPKARRAAADLAELIGTLREQAQCLHPAQLLDLAVERSGYRAWIERKSDRDADLQSLSELRALAERATTGVGDWLAELQLGEEPETTGDDAGHVLLTTIHGAKGGEWSVVFVVGVEEGLLPHARAASISTATGSEHRSPDEGRVLDELRVAYVAVTRPRDRLYLTSCRERRRGDRIEPRIMSRFLRDLPPQLLNRAA
jgi:DNA helicase II / ATP-dependent DNA helicase PcrA